MTLAYVFWHWKQATAPDVAGALRAPPRPAVSGP